MSTPNPTPNARPPRLPPQLLKVLAIAFAAGLLLFFLVWLKSRRHYDFYKSDGTDTATGQTSALPAPLPPDLANDSATPNASGLSLPKDGVIAAPPVNTAATSDAVVQSSPAPRYPQDALRRGLGGTVKVRASIAADGSVADVALAEGSGNRDLDRAALEAVRRWRFKPATRNGQPVASEVSVPIVFSPIR